MLRPRALASTALALTLPLLFTVTPICLPHTTSPPEKRSLRHSSLVSDLCLPCYHTGLSWASSRCTGPPLWPSASTEISIHSHHRPFALPFPPTCNPVLAASMAGWCLFQVSLYMLLLKEAAPKHSAQRKPQPLIYSSWPFKLELP